MTTESPCPYESTRLFCASWHDCLPDDVRREVLDEWSAVHHKPSEPLRARPPWELMS